jgi:hypothetical protein
MSKHDPPCHCDQVLVNDVGTWATDRAVATARAEPIPKDVKDRRLFCVERFFAACQKLTERGGRTDFPLSMVTLGLILDTSDFVAWRAAMRLVEAGVVERTRVGTMRPSGGPSGTASRWRFIGRGGLLAAGR